MTPWAVAVLAMLITGAGWSQSIEDRAAALRDAEGSPGDAVAELMGAGFSAPRATRAVVDAWADCEATYQAVTQALGMQPEALSSVVSAVAGASGCGCSGEALWGRSRLEARLRPTSNHFLVSVNDDCGCSAAAVGAASEVLPERSDEAMASAIGTLQPTAQVLDSIGRLGDATWSNGLARGRMYHRNANACVGDSNLEDDFQPVEWGETERPPDCEASGPMLAAVNFGERDAFLAVVNRTDAEIDLAAQRLAVDVYFRDQGERAYRLPLTGRLQPGQRQVLIGADAEPTAGVVSTELTLNLGDAVALVQQALAEDCDCAQPIGGATTPSSREDGGLASRLGGLDAPLACRADLVQFIEAMGDQPTFFAQDPSILRPEDSLDPDRVDPIASPN